eukprot:80154-Hanusia_phi.AAC.1
MMLENTTTKMKTALYCSLPSLSSFSSLLCSLAPSIVAPPSPVPQILAPSRASRRRRISTAAIVTDRVVTKLLRSNSRAGRAASPGPGAPGPHAAGRGRACQRRPQNHRNLGEMTRVIGFRRWRIPGRAAWTRRSHWHGGPPSHNGVITGLRRRRVPPRAAGPLRRPLAAPVGHEATVSHLCWYHNQTTSPVRLLTVRVPVPAPAYRYDRIGYYYRQSATL